MKTKPQSLQEIQGDSKSLAPPLEGDDFGVMCTLNCYMNYYMDTVPWAELESKSEPQTSIDLFHLVVVHRAQTRSHVALV